MNNETWISSDFGQTWKLLTYYTFPKRDHATQAVQVSSAGVIVVAGGKLSESVTLYANGQPMPANRTYTMTITVKSRDTDASLLRS